jgi:hypothetical protein
MARLLFIENREKTFFWAAIARLLVADGHHIAWLVQNPLFGRGLPGRRLTIPFPTVRDLDPTADPADYPDLETDRGRDYFEGGAAHYPYYAATIDRLIEAERPDLVIGEPTLFHELLALGVCTRRNILFAHPVGERYPPGRFNIFYGPTQRPLIFSGERLDPELALDLATRIRDGHAMPAYMSSGGRYGKFGGRLWWALTRGRVVAGRWLGERYNTPSVAVKRRLNQMTDRNLKRWQAAASLPDVRERTILYPLQQQPENTIDVWGRPDWDQARIVKRILAATPDDVMVAMKANPKPYYELSDALLDLAERDARICLLPLEMRMPDTAVLTTGAITVTGTVGYEAVCGRGRCLSLAHPVLDDHFPHFTAPSIEAAAQRLLEDPEAGRGSAAEGVRLLQELTNRSFPGSISDPVSAPASMAHENIEAVTHGVRLLIEKCL